MLNLTVSYYAVLREERGVAQEVITTDARTPSELYNELQMRHALSLGPTSLRVAINDEFVRMDQQLREGDEVTFIAPVAGG